MNETIFFDLVDLENEKFTEQLMSYIELRDRSIKWKVIFYADHPKNENDIELGWENDYGDITVVAMKKDISGLRKSYRENLKLWRIDVVAYGLHDDIRIYYKDEYEAMKLFNKLDKYLHDGN